VNYTYYTLLLQQRKYPESRDAMYMLG